MTGEINVKIPEIYTKIIDDELKGRKLSQMGFKSRVHFVSTAVGEKLLALGLLKEDLVVASSDRD